MGRACYACSCIIGLAAGFSALATAGASGAAGKGPSYRYQGTRLFILGISAEEKSQALISRLAIDRAGKPVGRARRGKAIVGPKGKPLMVKVGERPGHRVTIQIGRRRVTLWPSRGTWYARPIRLQVQQDAVPRPTAAFQAADDILLASGMRFRSASAGSRLRVGRTMGFEGGSGIRVPPTGALALVARGNVKAIRVIITERKGPKTLRYYDYPLVITPRLRRYLIPFAAFTPRDLRPGSRLKTIHSVALETIERAPAGSEIEVDQLALRQKSIRLVRVNRRGRSVQVRWSGKPRDPQVGWIDVAGKQHSRNGRNGMRLPATARGVWLCHGTGSRGGCCPADAPSTRIAPPPARGQPLVVDDFVGLAPVDPFRRPHLLFASNPALQQTMQAKRTGSSLTIAFTPQSAADYAGVRVALPPKLGRGYKTIELTLRGRMDPNSVALGVRDIRGKEPKVPLGGYVEALGGQRWTTVRVPLAAFHARARGFKDPRPLRQLTAVTVALEVNAAATEHRLEIDRIRLLRKDSPLAVASFDTTQGQTDLSGPITSESRFGATVSHALVQGQRGNGLKIDVNGVGGKAYGLISLGLRDIDARAYKELSFWIRGAEGGETPSLVLKDRRPPKAKSRIAIASLVQITTKWQRVRVPLRKLRRLVKLKNLRALLFTWEDQTISSQTIYIDGITLQ